MSAKKFIVELDAQERARLDALISKGKAPAKLILEARILLKADQAEGGPGLSAQFIIAMMICDECTSAERHEGSALSCRTTFMTKPFLTVVCIALSVVVSALAGATTVGADTTYYQSVSSGKSVRVYIAWPAFRDCKVAGSLDVEITVRPTHGTTTKRTGARHLAGCQLNIKGISVYYKSNPGYRGLDRVGVRLRGPDLDGNPVEISDIVEIEVQ